MGDEIGGAQRMEPDPVQSETSTGAPDLAVTHKVR